MLDDPVRFYFTAVGRVGGALTRRLLVRDKAIVGRGTIFVWDAGISNLSSSSAQVRIGNDCLIGWRLVSEREEILDIGDHTQIQHGTLGCAMKSVQIVRFCNIAQEVYTQDNNSHSLDWRQRKDDILDDAL